MKSIYLPVIPKQLKKENGSSPNIDSTCLNETQISSNKTVLKSFPSKRIMIDYHCMGMIKTKGLLSLTENAFPSFFPLHPKILP